MSDFRTDSMSCEGCPLVSISFADCRHTSNEDCKEVIIWLDEHDEQIRADEREKVLQAVIDSGWHCEIHSNKALNEMVSEELKEHKND